SKFVDAAVSFLKDKKKVLETLSPVNYAALDHAIGGSVGGHMHHMLDHFGRCLAVVKNCENSEDQSEIAYDRRERGGNVETNPFEASKTVDELVGVLIELQGQDGGAALRETTVAPAFLLGSSGPEFVFESNLERELFFCCHHGFHHDAMIRLILSNQGNQSVDEGLGLAPSTANFRRGSGG
ncbi:unnamed protein product, partial [Discosporangium mesarthrocarpum]